MNNYDYIAIDFETCNANLTSACSIGLVFVKNGKVCKEIYHLINPNEEFNLSNTLINGITYEMVKDEKTFDLIYNEIKDEIDGNILIAHASSFDIKVLKALIDKYNLEYPNIKIGCTLKASRIVLKDRVVNFKLNTISEFLDVNHNHHNALSDAYVCYYFIEYAKRMYNSISIEELFDNIGLGFGKLSKDYYRGCYSIINRIISKKTNKNRLEGKIVAFTGKPRCMTKNELKKLITDNAGIYSKGIIKAINMFIILSNPVSKEVTLANKLALNKDIIILNEQEFMGYINGK